METSIFLAKVIGLFGAISTLAIIIRYETHLVMEENAVQSPAVIYLSGFLFLLLGILVTVSHQVWTRDWRVVITILGWLLLAKGLMRIFFPEAVKKFIEKKRNDRRFLLAEVVTFFISLYLIYQGFIGH
ncbi:MAG: hypothetical protein HY707_09105 [Ignavibacteriae bacterium]|nr:hypothetical protein [Ignavibacteriota bacterium]